MPVATEQEKNTPPMTAEESERANAARNERTKNILNEQLIQEFERFLDDNKDDPSKVQAFLEKVSMNAENGTEALNQLKQYWNNEAMRLAGNQENTEQKQTKNPDTPEEKEKLITYAELSDLAYVDFVTVPNETDPSKTLQKISKAHLDPLAFPNLKMIAEGKIPEEPTEDEWIVMAYLDAHKNFMDNLVARWIRRATNSGEISPDVADILHLAGLVQGTDNPRYASLDEKYRTVTIDTNPNLPRVSRIQGSKTMSDRSLLMIDAMEHLKTIKEKQVSTVLETIKSKGFEIVDYFPNETSKDGSSSGFGAICLKDKDGNIHLAIRGTDVIAWVIPEPRDVIADAKLVLWKVPENQTQDLIAFFERNLKNAPEGQKINIVGHSLGWALAQIASVMYAERVGESCTFNSPWAKKLSIDPEGKSDTIRQKFEKFRDFRYNKGDTTSVENRMTNVRGTKWPSVIANLWIDIGNYEIKLERLSSHSITKLVEYIEKEATDEELERKYVWPDKIEETKESSF